MVHTTTILSDYKHIFSEDPIVVTSEVQSGDVPVAATVPQLVIRVTANGHVHEIAQQFIPNAGELLYTDISSALQAEYQLLDRKQEPTPNLDSHSYTTFSATVQAYVRYLIDETEYNAPVSDVIRDVNVLRGGLKPQYRHVMALNPSAGVQAFADKMTTKPHIPTEDVLTVANPSQHPANPLLLEIKNVGDKEMESVYDTSPLTSQRPPIVRTTATSVTSEGATAQLITENNASRQQLIFRNSLGVIETFSVFSLLKNALSVNSEEYAILSSPSYTPTLNVLTQAQNPSRKWNMSTGFIPSEWAEWFVTEVLTATYMWMATPIINPKTGEKTHINLPVHLEAEEITLADFTKNQLPEVKFTAILPAII